MMKKTVFLLWLLFLLFCSCSKVKYVDPEVKFYIDGTEVLTDTLYPNINSYAEVRIVSVMPRGNCGYTWRNINGFPINLRSDYTNLQIIMHTQPLYDDEHTGLREVAEFKMLFSDSLYQVGDHYKLKVSCADTYERTLNFIVVSKK